MREKQRGKTLLEALHPAPPEELVQTASVWVEGCSETILDSLWRAYDTLLSNPELKPALAAATEDLERGITRLLYFALDDLLTGDEPFRPLHGAPEDECRKPAPARPPEYDIAFAMRDNPRIMWSVEAKVLPKPTSLADYTETLNERFLSGTYAPFISEGAMAAYLLSGKQDEAFKAIAERLATRLAVPARWRGRGHRVSAHRRNIPTGRPYPPQFRCHHLVMEFG